MQCPKCGKENDPGTNFCVWCGAPLGSKQDGAAAPSGSQAARPAGASGRGQASRQGPARQPEAAAPARCPTCGAPLSPGAAFCESCGARVAAAPPKKADPKVVVAAVAVIVLLVLFLGRTFVLPTQQDASGDAEPVSSSSYDQTAWMYADESGYVQYAINGTKLGVAFMSDGKETALSGSLLGDDGSFSLEDGEKGTLAVSGDTLVVTYDDGTQQELRRSGAYACRFEADDGADDLACLWISGQDVAMSLYSGEDTLWADSGTLSSDGTITFYGDGTQAQLTSDGSTITYTESGESLTFEQVL